MTKPADTIIRPGHNTDDRSAWFVLVVVAHCDAEEIISALLWEAGCTGIVTEDTIEESRRDGTVLPDDHLRMKAYFRVEQETTPAQLRESLLDKYSLCCQDSGLPSLSGDPTIAIEAIPEIDYQHIWRTFHQPLEIGSSWILCPPWDIRHEPPRNTIILEPSMAFGTGQHESTQLVMMFLEEAGSTYGVDSVFDCGCGSGVLALAAVLSGAERVVAIDNDFDSVTICLKNCNLNGMQARIGCLTGSVECCRDQSFTLVLANLQKEILDEIGLSLLSLVTPGGVCCLSGLLVKEAEELAEQYRRLSFECIWDKTFGEWRSFAVRKSRSFSC